MKETFKQPKNCKLSLAYLNVLIVEDNLLNKKLLWALLKKMDIEADIADNGKEALEMFEKKIYDIVLMDIEMPKMGGVEATKIIREKYKDENIKIIAITAHAMKGAKEHFIDSGMNDYICKPINPNELIMAICKQVKSDRTNCKFEN